MAKSQETERMTAGAILWRVVMAVVALWLVVWMLRISGINFL